MAFDGVILHFQSRLTALQNSLKDISHLVDDINKELQQHVSQNKTNGKALEHDRKKHLHDTILDLLKDTNRSDNQVVEIDAEYTDLLSMLNELGWRVSDDRAFESFFYFNMSSYEALLAQKSLSDRRMQRLIQSKTGNKEYIERLRFAKVILGNIANIQQKMATRIVEMVELKEPMAMDISDMPRGAEPFDFENTAAVKDLAHRWNEMEMPLTWRRQGPEWAASRGKFLTGYKANPEHTRADLELEFRMELGRVYELPAYTVWTNDHAYRRKATVSRLAAQNKAT